MASFFLHLLCLCAATLAWRLALSPLFFTAAARLHFGLFCMIFKEGSASSVTLPVVVFFLYKTVLIVASFCLWMFTKHVHVVRCYRDKGQLVATARNKMPKRGVEWW